MVDITTLLQKMLLEKILAKTAAGGYKELAQ
jgi:hypothetical protein